MQITNLGSTYPSFKSASNTRPVNFARNASNEEYRVVRRITQGRTPIPLYRDFFFIGDFESPLRGLRVDLLKAQLAKKLQASTVALPGTTTIYRWYTFPKGFKALKEEEKQKSYAKFYNKILGAKNVNGDINVILTAEGLLAEFNIIPGQGSTKKHRPAAEELVLHLLDMQTTGIGNKEKGINVTAAQIMGINAPIANVGIGFSPNSHNYAVSILFNEHIITYWFSQNGSASGSASTTVIVDGQEIVLNPKNPFHQRLIKRLEEIAVASLAS